MRALLLAGLVVMGASGVTEASTISGGTASYTGAIGDDRQLGSLSKFDTSLGTLTGVSFTYGYFFNSTITVTAISSSSGDVRLRSAAKFDSSDSAIDAIFDAVANTRPNATIGPRTLSPVTFDVTGTLAQFSLGAGQTAILPTKANIFNSYNDTTRFVGSTLLSAFVASSTNTTFDVFGTMLAGVILNGPPGTNVTTSAATTVSQYISVNYTYNDAVPTDVPEPASLAFLAAGLLGAGVIRRRRSA